MFGKGVLYYVATTSKTEKTLERRDTRVDTKKIIQMSSCVQRCNGVRVACLPSPSYALHRWRVIFIDVPTFYD